MEEKKSRHMAGSLLLQACPPPTDGETKAQRGWGQAGPGTQAPILSWLSPRRQTAHRPQPAPSGISSPSPGPAWGCLRSECVGMSWEPLSPSLACPPSQLHLPSLESRGPSHSA